MHFLEENVCILIPIYLKFAAEGLTDGKTALVQVMAWEDEHYHTTLRQIMWCECVIQKNIFISTDFLQTC